MDKLSLNNKVILVTGAAGFIGSNLVKRLLNDLTGATIVGIDNMNAYYDPSLKEYRLKELDALSQCLRFPLREKVSQSALRFGRRETPGPSSRAISPINPPSMPSSPSITSISL